MRINPNPNASDPDLRRLERPESTPEASNFGVMPATGEDTAQLSFAGGAVAALKSRLASMPEVRQERVQALRQALASGAYSVNSQQLADAVFNEMLGPVRK